MACRDALLVILVVASILSGCARGGGRASGSAASPPRETPDFETSIRPILEAQCAPCHFEGGVMYDRLPFDRPGTIRDLKTGLLERIDDERQRALVRAFLDGSP